MSNSKSIIKNTKKQLAQLAKDVAKEGTAEILNTPKAGLEEKVAKDENRKSPIVEAMEQGGQDEGISAQGLKNVTDIDQEMAELRRKRKEEEEKAREPKPPDAEPKLSEPGKPLLPSSPRKGAKISRPEKQKTKIESRLGKN